MCSRHVPRRPGKDIQSFVNNSAYRLLRAQEENMVLKPWVLLSCLLLQDHQQKLKARQEQGMPLDELTAQAVWLRDVSRQYGAFLHWPGTDLNYLGRSREAKQAEGSLTHPAALSASSRPSPSIGGGLLQSVPPSWSSEGRRGPGPADSGSRFELNCVFSAFGLAFTTQRMCLNQNMSVSSFNIYVVIIVTKHFKALISTYFSWCQGSLAVVSLQRRCS